MNIAESKVTRCSKDGAVIMPKGGTLELVIELRYLVLM